MNATLFSEIQRLFERTYAQVGINLEDCLIDRQRCGQLSRAAGASARELSELARTFLRKADDRLYVGIYYSRWLIEQLERHDPRKGISELARVVRSGGRIVVLEFGQPANRFVRTLYDFYRARILPIVGGAITGRQDAYRYLESSAARFPCGDEFVAMMRESATFQTIEYEPLTFGVAYLYCATR